jgi:hypothetical protein
MPSLKCNDFRAFLKCLEPIGDDLVFQFVPTGIEVKAMGGGASQLLNVKMDMNPGFTGVLGFSLEMFKKLLPKELETVDIEFGKETVITGVGFKSKVAAINETTCCHVPKKDIPVNPGAIRVDAQKMYERITSLKTAFDGSAFDLILNAEKPTTVEFSDFDSAMGSMNNSVPTLTPVVITDRQILPYDVVLPILNVIRNQVDGIDLRFADMPNDKDCKALVIEGVIPFKETPVHFQYVVAPRVKDV